MLLEISFRTHSGGYLADRFLGQRTAITIGGITMALGEFALFSTQSRTFLWIGLILLIVGNGFFKPNISTIVGKLYPEGDKRKDSAFTIFYMGINLGAFIAPFICGTLAESTMAVKQGATILHYGFRYGFLAAGIGMIIGQIMFNLLGNKYLGDEGKYPVKNNVEKSSNVEIKEEDARKPLTKQEKSRTAVILILVAFNIFFWTGYEQAGSSLTLFTEESVNRTIFGFQCPVSWFQSINPVFIIILAPIIAGLWIKLSKRPKGDLNIPTKMALGLIFLGCGFLFIALPALAIAGNSAAKISMLWVVGIYFIHTVGELCLSPIGLSMVSTLAPKKIASFLMGCWFLSSFFANKLAGFIAGFIETYGPLQLFLGLAAVSIVIGLILLSLNKKLAAMME
jgi:POT family proton-dependent oligopeptide transporter